MSFLVAAATLGSILFLNLWLMAGSLVLSRAIDRRDVARPKQVVHSVVLMAGWPWLIWLSWRHAAVKPRVH